MAAGSGGEPLPRFSCPEPSGGFTDAEVRVHALDRFAVEAQALGELRQLVALGLAINFDRQQ